MGDLNCFIEAMPMPLFIVQQDLILVSSNQKARDLISDIPENKEITVLLPTLNNHLQVLDIALQNNEIQKIPKVELLGEETRKYWDIFICPFLHHDLHAVILVCDDITDKINYQNLIIKSEKLSSLGLLLAGIAHEINNPINFISTNIMPLKNDVNDLISVLNKFSEISPDVNLPLKLEEINILKNQIDIQYVLEEIPKLIEGIHDGARRTAEIVKQIRSYSRTDDKMFSKGNINELIKSSLILLKNNYKDRIKIVQNFGDIPDIDCIPGKISQVFMNLLANATQAIEKQGEICIKTECVDNTVKIYIRDNGAGISKENKEKIFESFFTTKDENTGTGLGLTITLSIIQEHKGMIEVNSEFGKGTEFIITLPITQEKVGEQEG